MKETVILTPGIRKQEILRSLASSQNSLFGCRFVDAGELAERMFLSAGILAKKETLPKNEEAFLIASFLREIPYFEASSFEDALSLSRTILTIRSLLRFQDDDALFEILNRGEFPEKNKAVEAVYRRYREELKRRGLMDETDILMEALKKGSSFDADFVCLKEFPLTPLEEELLKKASAGSYREVSLSEFIPEQQGKEPVYTKAYGSVNEAEDILSTIFREGIPLDQCVIACSDSRAYAQLFYDLSCRYEVPMSFGNGISILNSHPGSLLKLLYERNETGYNGIDATFDLLNSPLLDPHSLEEVLEKEPARRDLRDLSVKMGSLRIGFDREYNTRVLDAHGSVLLEDLEEAKRKDDRKAIREKEREILLLTWTKRFAEIFSGGILYTLDRLCLMREEGIASLIDRTALLKINSTIMTAGKHLPQEEVTGLIPWILRQNCGREGTKEGTVFFTDIRGALSSLRPYLFVCGLSADLYPGSPKEDPLLLDSDLKEFHEEKALYSHKKIQKRKEEFHSLISAAKKRGTDIFLSYSSYDLVSLKQLNPSSVLFESYEREHGPSSIDDFRDGFRKAGFFDARLSSSEKILKDYLNNRKPVIDPYTPEEEDIGNVLDREWSPSALEDFFECPKRFYLERILRLENIQPDDPYQILPATDTGTLAHALMEVIGEEPGITKEEFLERTSAAFDRVLTGRPALSEESAVQFKEEFLEMMDQAYDQDPKRGAVSAEEETHHTYPNGIKLKGYPDRVEALDNGRDIIVDFKTKRKVEHRTDDIDSCLQVVVYAWLCAEEGMPISYAEYRYTRLKRQVRCAWSEEMKEALRQKMETFKDALVRREFPLGKKKKDLDPCRYCTLRALCGKDEEVNDNDR